MIVGVSPDAGDTIRRVAGRGTPDRGTPDRAPRNAGFPGVPAYSGFLNLNVNRSVSPIALYFSSSPDCMNGGRDQTPLG